MWIGLNLIDTQSTAQGNKSWDCACTNFSSDTNSKMIDDQKITFLQRSYFSSGIAFIVLGFCLKRECWGLSYFNRTTRHFFLFYMPTLKNRKTDRVSVLPKKKSVNNIRFFYHHLRISNYFCVQSREFIWWSSGKTTVLRWFNYLNNYSHPNCQLIQFADETLILSYGKSIDQGKKSFESAIANLFKYFNKKTTRQ